MKEVLLADLMFTDYDIGVGASYLIPVRVTSQCYEALKANGFVLSKDEVEIALERFHLAGVDRSKAYGGDTGFEYKELMKFLSWGLAKSYQVRTWGEKAA